MSEESFEPTFAKERERISKLRNSRGVPQNGLSDLVGLALSSGGIRSATFCLGVLQALAAKGLLRGIDYLSCVGGGGYIGGRIAAMIEREGFENVNKELRKARIILPNPPSIRFFRRSVIGLLVPWALILASTILVGTVLATIPMAKLKADPIPLGPAL